MRAAGIGPTLIAFALLGCHKTESVAPPPAVEAAAPSVTAPSSVPVVASSAPDAAPPARPLPAAAALRAIVKDAHGFVAVTGDGQRAVIGVGTDGDVADTPVLVASFTKLIVAVALLRLVARKELSLDDEIRALVPELRAKPWADSTLREVMSHTSRIPELDAGFYSRTDVDFTHPAAVLAKEVSAATEKRGVWKYRNSEYAVLGAVLEAKGGQPAAEVLAREVFKPAGMKHAGIVVKGRPHDVDFLPMGRTRPENFFTAGDGYASPSDLLAFFEALGSDTLLDAATRALLFTGMPNHDQAALGCWAYPYAGSPLLVERPGSFGNVKLVSVFYPAERRALVFWTKDPIEVGKPRTKNSIAAKLAHVALE